MPTSPYRRAALKSASAALSNASRSDRGKSSVPYVEHNDPSTASKDPFKGTRPRPRQTGPTGKSKPILKPSTELTPSIAYCICRSFNFQPNDKINQTHAPPRPARPSLQCLFVVLVVGFGVFSFPRSLCREDCCGAIVQADWGN